MLPVSMMVIGGWVLFKKDETLFSTQNSYSLMDHIQTSFGLRKITAAGLKITMFCLSYVHPALRQVKLIKC
jgi:hypothetical protein